MNRDELKKRILLFASVGMDKEGAVNRVFGSDFMKDASRAMKLYMEEAGMESFIDSVGNVHGLYRTVVKDAPVIFAGSHLDTVKEGGIFDGLLGVIAAVECVRELAAEKYPLHCGIHVVATNGEEGNELGGTFGSRAMMGMLDTDDSSYLEKCLKYGYTKDALENAVLDVKNALCYLELHIEQGKTLYEDHKQIGAVTGIVGLQRYQTEVLGESNHAGTTMMEYRKDALVEAAKVILKADELAREFGHHMVATIGKMDVSPGAVAVIPGKVDMILEFRNQDEQRIENSFGQMKESFEKSGNVNFTPLVKKKPVKCDPKIVDMIIQICKEQGISCVQMPSGATHDGNAMAMKMPIGMIFVPSKDGISHSVHEWTEWDEVETGVKVLYETIKRLDQSAGRERFRENI